MGIATGYTADHMDAIEAACIVSGSVVGDELILTRFDGTTIDAGDVRGPQGIQGVKGDTGPQGPGNATDADVSTFINTAGSASQQAVDARARLVNVVTDWNAVNKPGFYYNSTKTNAPDAHNYMGYATANPGSTALTVVVWREDGTTIANMEQWSRTGSSTSWSPWVRLFGDTGWITSNIFTSANGSSITSQVGRIKNGIAYVSCVYGIGVAFANNTSGDIGNRTVLNVADTRFLPSSVVNGIGSSSIGNGRIAAHAIYTDSTVILSALGGASNIAVGDPFSFWATYPVD